MNEITLHKHLTEKKQHKNIIRFFGAGEDASYLWIAMELAEGGDLFDKIESDVGVGVDISHVYFTQLINAISFMHSMGVAHRDIKPENILLNQNGDLKLADFGLATLYKYQGKMKKSTSTVGSPPYMAPDVVKARQDGYEPDVADIWSCGIVLFVLLVGNTPWDEPTKASYEFNEYLQTGGKTTDDLWTKIPSDVMSLILGMLKPEPQNRFRLNEIRTHPWFTKPNQHLSLSGTIVDPVKLATQMMENLRVDFDVPPSQHTQQIPSELDAMDLDYLPPTRSAAVANDFMSATQPEAPMAEDPFCWERRVIPNSQPLTRDDQFYDRSAQIASEKRSFIENDVSMSQFTKNPQVPVSLTQMANRFSDIAPSWSVNHFISDYPLDLLVEKVTEALMQVSVQTTKVVKDRDSASIQVTATYRRRQAMKGHIVMERHGREHFDVRFVKAKGDPIEWRRLFKDVARLCKDLIAGRELD
jgi:serine/threonine-protein kinase Chk1